MQSLLAKYVLNELKEESPVQDDRALFCAPSMGAD